MVGRLEVKVKLEFEIGDKNFWTSFFPEGLRQKSQSLL